MKPTTKKWNWFGYLYILPGLILYLVFFIRPLIQLIRLSLVEWSGVGEKVFVGLENYKNLLTSDPIFWMALRNNIIWLFAAIVIPIVVGFILAIILTRSALYARVVFRTIFFLPQVLSSAVVAIIWRWIYNPNYGAINAILHSLGLGSLARAWLGETSLALMSLFIAWSWIHYGFCMVIFIAALQSIDETYYDAAKVDGANLIQQQWFVTIPFIRNALATIVLITAISAFEVFDLVFIITKGGPARATIVLSLYMYDSAFRYGKVGYASAIAVILGLVIFLLSLFYMNVRNRMELE